MLLLAVACAAPPQPAAPTPAVAPVAPVSDEAAARRAFDEGVVFGRQGRWPEAEQRYRRAVALASDDAALHFALAGALLNQNRAGEAADVFQHGIDVEERADRPNHTLLAEDYERLIQILTRLAQPDRVAAARERQRYHRELRDVLLP